MGGKLLSDWPNPHLDVFPPSVDAFVTDANKDVFEAFAKRIFSNCEIDLLHDRTKLKSFRDTMVASLLMHLESHVASTTDSDPVVQKIRDAGAQLDLDFHKLVGWGREVRMRFQAENIGQATTGSSDPALVQAIKEMSTHVLDVQAKQKVTDARQVRLEERQVAMEARQKVMEENNEKRHQELLGAILAYVHVFVLVCLF